jgi:glycosyltransferase involved in cell wall biosynthesis
MPDLTSRIERLELGDSVWLHEAVTHEQMPAVLGKCDVGMVAYGRRLGEDSLPNRLFEYMASGIAILAPTYALEIKRIVEAEDIGLTVDFEQPEEVADAMRWFIEHPQETKAMGARARIAFIERHNWDAEFHRLVAAMASQSGKPTGVRQSPMVNFRRTRPR